MWVCMLLMGADSAASAIDRAAVVRRHNVHFEHEAVSAPLTDDDAFEVLYARREAVV